MPGALAIEQRQVVASLPVRADLQRFPLIVDVLLVITTLGLGALVTGAYMNLQARLSRPRAENERGLAAIHDRVTRRTGPLTWRIGGWTVLATTPLLLLALSLTD